MHKKYFILFIFKLSKAIFATYLRTSKYKKLNKTYQQMLA